MKTSPLLNQLLRALLTVPGTADVVAGQAEGRWWPETLIDHCASIEGRPQLLDLTKRAHEEFCRLNPERARPLFDQIDIEMFGRDYQGV